ncbi:hypothetical protein ACVFYP_26385 [Roseomonas sp. F4]
MAALAALACPARAAPAPAPVAVPVPEAATLLAAGPEDGLGARLAARAASTLARGLVQATALRVSVLGGPDGITAANRFASSSAGDGPMLLLLPGLAVQAQLVGDTRARFEPRHWPAICGNERPSLLAIRPGLRRGATLRLALSGPASPEAGALLALDLLGRPAAPVFGLPIDPGPNAGLTDSAIREGAADAMVLCGTGAVARAAALGLVPLFAFDAPGHARDAAMPDVPALGEVLADPTRPDLLEAVRATGAALRSQALLVLPALTSANIVAMWRGAAQSWAEEAPDVPEAGSRRLGPGAATLLLGTLCPGPEAALSYRLWLQSRLNYRAS